MDLFLSLAGSLILTLLLELGLALLWGVKGEDLTTVALANVLTNPVVVLCHHVTGWYAPGFRTAVTLALELGAVLVEGLVYGRRSRIVRPLAFSLWANAVSFLTGLLLF
ncbi:MAG: hypothetical protein HFF18_06120 [Oscillospiraceae bacterium]|nr:hypothetical protein [Oscillospiraceae bacterium]